MERRHAVDARSRSALPDAECRSQNTLSSKNGCVWGALAGHVCKFDSQPSLDHASKNCGGTSMFSRCFLKGGAKLERVEHRSMRWAAAIPPVLPLVANLTLDEIRARESETSHAPDPTDVLSKE